jgi:ABC-type glutathione transport system ATPase component
MSFIQITNLCAHYADTPALSNASLTLRAGRITAIIGESGAGKSTLMYAILGLLSRRGGLASGTLSTETLALDFSKPSTADWDSFRGGMISLMPQDAIGSLDPCRTVRDQIMLATPKQRDVNARELLIRAGFPEPQSVLEKYPHELSGGMARRVAFAQSLARSSPFLLADEPTQGLDAINANAVLHQLKKEVNNGLGLAIISHDLRAVHLFADEIVVVHKGLIVEQIETPLGSDLQLKSEAGQALQVALNRLYTGTPQ